VLITNTDTSVTSAQGILIDCFTTGITMKAVRVLGSARIAFGGGIVYDSATAPSGYNGAFLQAVNCVTDGIQGTGLALRNCRQLQSSNNFWSCLHRTANYGVSIDGGVYFRFVNDEIGGCGVTYSGAPTDIAFTTCEFPATGTVAGVHHLSASDAPADLQIDRQSLSGRNGSGYQLTNNLAAFYGALTDPAGIGAVEAYPGVGPIYENLAARYVNAEKTPLTSGDVHLFRIWLPKGLPVTNICWCSGSTAFTPGAAIHYWAALYAASGGVASGAPLTQSADDSSPVIAASAVQQVPLQAPYVTTAAGHYYLSLFLAQLGGTMPSVMSFAGVGTLTNMTPKGGYIHSRGYDAGTAPVLSGNGVASLANLFWMGVS
jgi:hypothetical protein